MFLKFDTKNSLELVVNGYHGVQGQVGDVGHRERLDVEDEQGMRDAPVDDNDDEPLELFPILDQTSSGEDGGLFVLLQSLVYYGKLLTF